MRVDNDAGQVVLHSYSYLVPIPIQGPHLQGEDVAEYCTVFQSAGSSLISRSLCYQVIAMVLFVWTV